jgi:pimeloyl-ACP methyl ester carboxylesterase
VCRYWVIAYDNRDCGLSTKIDGSAADGQTLAKLFSEKKMGIRIDRTYGVPYMITELADDAAGLLEELGVASAHVVGFSR